MHRASLDGGFRDFSRGRPKYQSSRSLRAATSGMYGNRPQETRQQQPAGPILRSQQAWEGWPEVNVKLTGLPPTISTWDLWERFAAEGDIVFIELFENRNGGRNGEGKIRFRQPRTLRPFWKGQVLIEDPEGDGMKIIRASLQQGTRRFQIESPVRKGTWYKEVLQIPTSATEFGHMVEEDTMMVMKSCPSGGDETRSSISPTDAFHVDFKRQELEIKFSLVFRKDPSNESVENVDRTDRYSFKVPFNQLQRMSHQVVDGSHWALTFSLSSPPCFFRQRHIIEYTHKEGSLTWGESDSWFRQTDIIYDRRSLNHLALALEKETPVIDVGRWTTYRFIFKNGHGELFDDMRKALQDWNIEIIMTSESIGSTAGGVSSTGNDGTEIEMHSEHRPGASHLKAFKTVAAKHPTMWSLINARKDGNATWFDEKHISIPFEVRYQLEVCISQGYLNEHNITEPFLRSLTELALQDKVKARTILEWVAEQEVRVFDPMKIFSNQEALSYFPNSKIPHYCAYARKATITPSSLLYNSPTVETTNRVTRKFAAYGDRFLRIQFTDEKAEGRISACADKARNDELFSRVYRTLMNGIRIGDRHYQFLAFGNSQFRENGAFFFCETPQLSCQDIRDWMGNFDDIKVVAKYAARLGLCYSTTRAIHSARPKIVKLEDVDRNGYTFTDGVGKISDLLAKLIAHDLGITGYPPSAFQFRMGGCKGILAVSPDAKGQEIHIRKSQQKFSATYNGLEIIRCSQFAVASLNRQTISILTSLGVPDQIFNTMLVEQLSNYKRAMEESAVAQELLTRYIDDNHMTVTIAGLVSDGFFDSREPFIMSLLHLWRSWSIKLLKEKAKIIVEKGAFLLGVVDETATLKGHTESASKKLGQPENIDDLPEIFLQVAIKDLEGKPKYSVIEGVCVLGRNPSLHPGDIRVVRAVNVKALHHLRDVVVFSQNGDRDVPGMCSGGDLDGDDFFIIWDPNLIPKEWNPNPMNYKAPKPKEADNPVGMSDLCKFFVQYMKNDALGLIAHAHLAQADFLDRGVKDNRCIELAKLHSKAVDYNKSGEAAVLPKSLRPSKWPHFMEKRYKPAESIYHSHKILGQLYDQVENVNFVPQYEENFDKRILRAYPDLDNKILRFARQTKTQYDTAMRRHMANSDIATEFEIWTTFILSNPRVGSSYKLQEDVGVISNALKARFRNNIIDEVGGKDFASLAPMVAAMYRVTHEEMQIALHQCHTMVLVRGREVPQRTMSPKYMPLISFPWLFHEVLGRIATGQSGMEDLVELGLSVLPTARQNRSKASGNIAGKPDHMDDFLEMDNGVVVHRGETLDLFRPDETNSDDEAAEEPRSDFIAGAYDSKTEPEDLHFETDRFMEDLQVKSLNTCIPTLFSKGIVELDDRGTSAGSRSINDEDTPAESPIGNDNGDSGLDMSAFSQLIYSTTPTSSRSVLHELEGDSQDSVLTESEAAEINNLEKASSSTGDLADFFFSPSIQVDSTKQEGLSTSTSDLAGLSFSPEKRDETKAMKSINLFDVQYDTEPAANSGPVVEEADLGTLKALSTAQLQEVAKFNEGDAAADIEIKEVVLGQIKAPINPRLRDIFNNEDDDSVTVVEEVDLGPIRAPIANRLAALMSHTSGSSIDEVDIDRSSMDGDYVNDSDHDHITNSGPSFVDSPKRFVALAQANHAGDSTSSGITEEFYDADEDIFLSPVNEYSPRKSPSKSPGDGRENLLQRLQDSCEL